MDKGTQQHLSLERMPHGGYLVWPLPAPHDFRQPLFACTTIGEALKFMRDLIEPEAIGGIDRASNLFWPNTKGSGS